MLVGPVLNHIEPCQACKCDAEDVDVQTQVVASYKLPLPEHDEETRS
jgi:hypothetical protein